MSLDTQNEETVSFKSVYTMIIMVKIVPFLYERETGKMEWGESKSGRKREREKERKSAGDRV
jgi:hypothetical protein